MKDGNGRNVGLGDRVRLWKGRCGRVVCAFDDDRFSDKYSRAEWSHLKTGVLIEMDTGDVFYYDGPDEDFRLTQMRS